MTQDKARIGPSHVPIGGRVWRVLWLPGGDPRLVDGTGIERLATTDPTTNTISVRRDLVPPTLDIVVLHEVAHALYSSWYAMPTMRRAVMGSSVRNVEELVAKFVEEGAYDALAITSEILGRPPCLRGRCD